MPKFPYTPILGWSHSRVQIFNACKRKYFYQYYDKTDPIVQNLKKQKSEALVVGEAVHDTIAKVLTHLMATHETLSRGTVMNDMIAHNWKYLTGPFQGSVPSADEFNDKTWSMVTTFLESERYQWLQKEPHQMFVIEPANFGECRVDGWKAYIKVDFALHNGTSVYVFDWKTGKSQNTSTDQLRAYSWWAREQFKVSAVTAMFAYLQPKYEEHALSFTEQDLNEFPDTVARETKAMYEYNADVQNNVPLDMSVFALTDEVSECRWCPFKQLCGR